MPTHGSSPRRRVDRVAPAGGAAGHGAYVLLGPREHYWVCTLCSGAGRNGSQDSPCPANAVINKPSLDEWWAAARESGELLKTLEAMGFDASVGTEY